MSYTARDLAKALVKDDTDAASEVFESIIKSRLFERISVERKNRARAIFGQAPVAEAKVNDDARKAKAEREGRRVISDKEPKRKVKRTEDDKNEDGPKKVKFVKKDKE